MYKKEFEENHKNLSELVSWLSTWEKYNKKEKRKNELDNGINRKRQYTNEKQGH